MRNDPTRARRIDCGCGEQFNSRKPFPSKTDCDVKGNPTMVYPGAKGYELYWEHYLEQARLWGLNKANREHFVALAV